jgi:hypothetical protein
VKNIESTVQAEGPDSIGEIIVEPIMSAVGIAVPPDEYLPEVEKICREYGILLHIDEVINGFGRTGKMFAHQHYGVSPDILAVAKGITSGYMPMAATLVTNQLLAAWLTASTRLSEDIRVGAETRMMRMPVPVSRTALIALRQKYEAEHGRVTDAIWPCAAMIEKRLEEIEEGSFRAVPLTEVICEEKGTDEHVEVRDLGSNVKIRKQPTALPLPGTTEEFRQRIETLAISYILAAYKHSTRQWLQSATMPVWDKYVKYILSEEVANFTHEASSSSTGSALTVKATWATVLGYELAMRKFACKAILYEGMTFVEAMNAAMKDLSIKERYFITPTAMQGCRGSPASQSTSQASNPGAISNKKRKAAERLAWIKENASSGTSKPAKGKGKGRGRGKGKGKGKNLKKTPDGRFICGFYGTPAGCKKDKCDFVHCCEWCFESHPGHTCTAA